MMITLPDGSQEIRNPDGSLYMRFPPAVPSSADLEGWSVRMVSTVHTAPARCQWIEGRWEPVGRVRDGASLTIVDVESFNGLLRLLQETSKAYGYRPSASWFGADSGYFRWTWERWENGYHLSDMIIASKIH